MVKPRYAYPPDHGNRTKAADAAEAQVAPDCPHRGNEAAAAICAVIRRIPKGWVATYGQVAAMAGLPRRARLVGHVLRHLDPATDIPWHRVVNAKGEVSYTLSRHGSDVVQQRLLEEEGVEFDDRNRFDLERFRWPE
jgi:methylated-DNA-protein-cysteine methyltransferase-like protein